MQYDEDTTFNESNVVMFLSELEEYISLFITYLAYKESNPDAAIASLSLDQMRVKDFDKNALQVDAKHSNEVAIHDDLETEDDLVTDPRQMYKNFAAAYSKEKGGV